MQIIDAQTVHDSLEFKSLIALLQHAFAQDFAMPQRHIHPLDPETSRQDALAILPAWNDDVIGSKLFTYFPENANHPHLNTLYSKILLFSRASGEPLAVVDGTRVTYWRTAAISALASQLLSRRNSTHMLLFGTGHLAPYLVQAHLAVRPLKTIHVVGRNQLKAQHLLAELKTQFPVVSFQAVSATAPEVQAADIICCATSSSEPLFDGGWLTAGSHVDCLGNHHPDQRECDSTTVTRSRVYVDGLDNCLAEAGELLLAIREGVFAAGQIIGELADLCRQSCVGRQSNDEITLFKSVGTAYSDLVTAHHVYQMQQDN